MFVFAHLGIGLKLASPWSRGLPRRLLLLGTLLPDLIDKPLYYGLAAVTGRKGAEIGLISGTRTFGHTALLMIVILALGAARKSKALAALGLGVATHLTLDCLGEYFLGMQGGLQGSVPLTPLPVISSIHAVLWPLLGMQFPIMPFRTTAEHLSSYTRNVFFVWAELLGITLLAWEFWKSSHRAEIVAYCSHRRLDLRKLRQRRRLRRPK